MKQSKFSKWFTESFMKGVTWFHIAGFVLLLFGGHVGTVGEVGGKEKVFHFTATLAQLAGFIMIFKDLARSLLKRKDPIVVIQKDGK